MFEDELCENETISDEVDNVGECPIQEGACAVDLCTENGAKWPAK